MIFNDARLQGHGGGGVTLNIFDSGRMAEITIDSTAKPPISAAELTRFMLANGVSAAKIVRTNNNAAKPPGGSAA